MPQLNDTQLVILSAAARRDDGAILLLPKSLKTNKAAAARILKSLIKRDLLAERAASHGDAVWREAEDGQRMRLVITEAGLQALGTEPDEVSKKTTAATEPQAGNGGGRTREPTAAGPKAKGAESSPVVRQGTKQALLIDLLKRKNGATIDEIVAATGWQPHSVRGAISGTLRKKLGLVIASEPVDGRGRVYRIETE